MKRQIVFILFLVMTLGITTFSVAQEASDTEISDRVTIAKYMSGYKDYETYHISLDWNVLVEKREHEAAIAVARQITEANLSKRVTIMPYLKDGNEYGFRVCLDDWYMAPPIGNELGGGHRISVVLRDQFEDALEMATRISAANLSKRVSIRRSSIFPSSVEGNVTFDVFLDHMLLLKKEKFEDAFAIARKISDGDLSNRISINSNQTGDEIKFHITLDPDRRLLAKKNTFEEALAAAITFSKLMEE